MPVEASKSLLVFLEGLGWSPLEELLAGGAVPFLSGLAGRGRSGPLAAGAVAEFPWSRLWRWGLGLGLFNPPGLERPRPLPGFMVCRRYGPRAFTHPPELARDLADYPPTPAWTRDPGLARLSRGRRDSLFAEQALYSRLGLEHCRRLCELFAVDLVILGWRGPKVVGRLFPHRQQRRQHYLAQLDRHLQGLFRALEPGLVLVVGLDPGGGDHGLVVGGRAAPGREWALPADWEGLLELLPATPLGEDRA